MLDCYGSNVIDDKAYSEPYKKTLQNKVSSACHCKTWIYFLISKTEPNFYFFSIKGGPLIIFHLSGEPSPG